ncbi:MAG: hypothetical protein ACI9N1_000346 [Flavobacteriales bacterium]|jgi:hypothetical protein
MLSKGKWVIPIKPFETTHQRNIPKLLAPKNNLTESVVDWIASKKVYSLAMVRFTYPEVVHSCKKEQSIFVSFFAQLFSFFLKKNL